MDGNVHIYKARLVAKGYTQTYMVDYEETFLPVADIRAIRILISITAFYDYEIWQMDVKTTFLNGYLDEDIYMVQPEEVFETFKVFKNEVENELGKTLRPKYDQFLMVANTLAKGLSYLKANGVCNTVSCNLVPTKKVDKTPSDCDGYPKEMMGYYLYFPPENKIVVARSERTRRATNRLCLNVEVEEHSLRDLREPANYKAIVLDPESKKWVDAMNAKMQSMIDNMVWVLVDLPLNCKTVGSKWIFKKKTNMDGNVHIYKARLVAKGYTQTYIVDYEETFSPVADIRAIRILISIAAFYDYEIWQMDVKTAFLNGYLDEDIYMNCQLKKSKSRVGWKNISLVKTFIEACIHAIALDGREGVSLKVLSRKKVAKAIKDNHNFEVDQKQMRNHFDYMKIMYGAWLSHKNRTGNIYDDSTNTFNLTEECK
ncbi:retrotransposon protein, putative, ty1-copia subclass [Tanacetum coccineum]